MLILECGMMSQRANEGAVRERLASMSSNTADNLAAKGVRGRVSSRGNYEFLIKIKQYRNKVSHRELKDESMG